MALHARDYGAVDEAQRLSGLFLAIAATAARDTCSHVARVAGIRAGEDHVRHGRLSLFRRYGVGGGRMDRVTEGPPGVGPGAGGHDAGWRDFARPRPETG